MIIGICCLRRIFKWYKKWKRNEYYKKSVLGYKGEYLNAKKME